MWASIGRSARSAKTPLGRCYVNVFFDFGTPGHYDSGPFGGIGPPGGEANR